MSSSLDEEAGVLFGVFYYYSADELKFIFLISCLEDICIIINISGLKKTASLSLNVSCVFQSTVSSTLAFPAKSTLIGGHLSDNPAILSQSQSERETEVDKPEK